MLYIVESPFNERDYVRFGVEVFINEGFTVEIWDISKILFSDIYESLVPADSMLIDCLVQFKKKKDIVNALYGLGDNTFIINLVKYRIETLFIFKVISEKNIPYSQNRFFPNLSEIYPANQRNFEFFLSRLSNFSIRNLISKLLITKRITNLLKIKPATYVFAGGAKSLLKGPLIDSTTERLFIHTLDYDIYLNQSKGKAISNNSIVFLDEYHPFHPDNYRANIHVTTPEEYYPTLCTFFDYLESKTGFNVIIAAHPRSHYDDITDYFDGRKVIRGETNELIRDSNFIIAHSSFSINFAVLYKKPIIFIITDEFKESIYERYVKYLAIYFGKASINISEKEIDIDLEKELSMDIPSYNKFKHNFIKIDGTPDLPVWEVISKKIKSSHGLMSS